MRGNKATLKVRIMRMLNFRGPDLNILITDPQRFTLPLSEGRGEEWNKQGGLAGTGQPLLSADSQQWDDGVLPVQLHTLIIRPCLGGTSSTRRMRGAVREGTNLSWPREGGVRGRASCSQGMSQWLQRVCVWDKRWDN